MGVTFALNTTKLNSISFIPYGTPILPGVFPEHHWVWLTTKKRENNTNTHTTDNHRRATLGRVKGENNKKLFLIQEINIPTTFRC